MIGGVRLSRGVPLAARWHGLEVAMRESVMPIFRPPVRQWRDALAAFAALARRQDGAR